MEAGYFFVGDRAKRRRNHAYRVGNLNSCFLYVFVGLAQLIVFITGFVDVVRWRRAIAESLYSNPKSFVKFSLLSFLGALLLAETLLCKSCGQACANASGVALWAKASWQLIIFTTQIGLLYIIKRN
ncbi:MAG: hypothetical protein KME30_00830 [Iphinoe sp. HA4291-MV1]|nr:hypothetical protein [Iphinoe sp. HA4291-MV1]